MGLEGEHIRGQTPLSEEEKEGLLISTISTQEELNEFEQYNIEKAVEWTLSRRFTTGYLLRDQFVKDLHHRMFREVWSWAGSFRRSNKKLGVEWQKIPQQLDQLLKDATYWVKYATFEPDELVIRFKHRLVNIHCFPDGNGRHARLLADTYISHIYGREVFTWGQSLPIRKSAARKQYIEALQKADAWDIEPLVRFARG